MWHLQRCWNSRVCIASISHTLANRPPRSHRHWADAIRRRHERCPVAAAPIMALRRTAVPAAIARRSQIRSSVRLVSLLAIFRECPVDDAHRAIGHSGLLCSSGGSVTGCGRASCQQFVKRQPRLMLCPTRHTPPLYTPGKELARSSGAEGNPPDFRVMMEGARQPLSPLLQGDVYRIAREIPRNAFHHAHASRIEAEIASTANSSGCGFAMMESASTTGLGEARAGALGIAGHPRTRETYRRANETLERTGRRHGSGADGSGPNCLRNSASPGGMAAVS